MNIHKFSRLWGDKEDASIEMWFNYHLLPTDSYFPKLVINLIFINSKMCIFNVKIKLFLVIAVHKKIYIVLLNLKIID